MNFIFSATRQLPRLGFILALLFVHPTLASFDTIPYKEDSTSSFPNPERGFFSQGNFWEDDYPDFDDLSRDYQRGITVRRVYMRIDDYVNSNSISTNFINQFNTFAENLRKTGVKIIPRFIYNTSNNGCQEATFDRIISHINQVAPALRANSDVIAYMEAGFIGMYGEWHYFNCGKNDPHSVENRKKILFSILDAVPNILVVLRYNFHKRAIFGSDIPLEPDSAFSGSRRSRVGANNDAFAVNKDNMGTYNPSSTNAQIEFQKNYLALDNRYVPQGGEPEEPDDPMIAGCDSAKADLRRMHWDVMNGSFNQRMHQKWREGNCRDEISRKLGYRLVMVNSVLQDSVRPGYGFYGNITLKNTGYGKIYRPRGAEIIFRNQSNDQKFTFKLNIDPRRLTMTDGPVNLPIQAMIPSNIPLGNYSVYLNLPDTAVALSKKKEFSIRLANANVWEDSTGYNSLLHKVVISNNSSTSIQGQAAAKLKGSSVKILKENNTVSFLIPFTSENYSLEVYDLRGNRVWQFLAKANATQSSLIRLKGVSSGVYFLRARLISKTSQLQPNSAEKIQRFVF